MSGRSLKEEEAAPWLCRDVVMMMVDKATGKNENNTWRQQNNRRLREETTVSTCEVNGRYEIVEEDFGMGTP